MPVSKCEACDCHKERALREQWQTMHEQLHTRDREALLLARDEAQRQFHLLNELRKEVLTDRTVLVSETVSKTLYDREHALLREELRALRKFNEGLSGERRGLGLGWQILVAGVGFIATVALLLNAIRLFWLRS